MAAAKCRNYQLRLAAYTGLVAQLKSANEHSEMTRSYNKKHNALEF